MSTRNFAFLSVLLLTISLVPLASHWINTWPGLSDYRVQEPNYQVQVFNIDPLILYIRNFIGKDEIKHILRNVQGKYETSRLGGALGDNTGHIDRDYRKSVSATVPRDDIVRRLEKRARKFMGWRNNDTHISPLKINRYDYNDFFSFHYDWIDEDDRYPGNRMTTFMIYLEADCTGGGTNFNRVPRPVDPRWCDVIACKGDEEYEEYPGVTFKPIAGSAVFWENFHANGTPHTATRHAALPVRSGHKMGLNIWSWDKSWRAPSPND